MEQNYIYRQTKSTPLYPDLIWSRPESKLHAGKLLIIGGNLHGFSSPAECYNEAEKAGAGSLRVIMPDKLRPLISKIFPAAEFTTSNPSGAFAANSLAEIMEEMEWANISLLSGDFGHNSETAIVIEKILGTKLPLVLTGDSIDNYLAGPRNLAQRNNLLIVTTFAKLQKITTNLRLEKPLTTRMDQVHLQAALNTLSIKYPMMVALIHEDKVFVTQKGKISITQITKDTSLENKVAAHASVWWMQNPTKPFEAISTSVLDFSI